MTLTPLERQEKAISLRDEAYLDEEKGCWLTKRCTASGYGRIWFRDKIVNLHRLAYAVFIDDFDDILHVLHKCDVKRCYNPEHLFLGTNTDNVKDMVAKGRQRSGMLGRTGEKHPGAKLREYQVIEILSKHEAGLSNRRIVKDYAISRRTIQNIVQGKTYALAFAK